MLRDVPPSHRGDSCLAGFEDQLLSKVRAPGRRGSSSPSGRPHDAPQQVPAIAATREVRRLVGPRRGLVLALGVALRRQRPRARRKVVRARIRRGRRRHRGRRRRLVWSGALGVAVVVAQVRREHGLEAPEVLLVDRQRARPRAHAPRPRGRRRSAAARARTGSRGRTTFPRASAASATASRAGAARVRGRRPLRRGSSRSRRRAEAVIRRPRAATPKL